jgi:hypothetical protein
MAFQPPFEKVPPHKRMVNMGGTHVRADEVLVVSPVDGRKPFLGGETLYYFIVSFRGGPGIRHQFDYTSEDAAEAARQRLLDAVEWFAGAR